VSEQNPNDPCACGSGRKAKKCCLRPVVPKGRRPIVDFPQIGAIPAQKLSIAQATTVARKFHAHGNVQIAGELFRLILDADGECDEARFYYGVLLHQSGKSDEGVQWMKQAVASSSHVSEYHADLGAILDQLQQSEESVACFRKAHAIRETTDSCYNLGVALMNQGVLEEAAAWFRRAIAVQPLQQSSNAYCNLSSVLFRQGKLLESIENVKIALALNPNDVISHSNYLLMLNFVPHPDPQVIFQAHKDFGLRHQQFVRSEVPPIAASTPWQTHRRIRIGYLSSDFRQHSVAHFIEPVLAAHDKSKFELFGYYHHTADDEITKRIRNACDHWRTLVGLSDQQIAAQVRTDHIDILVDLCGHAGLNRLLCFMHKPAPIQVTWLGYPNTTGLSTMDFRITDAFADPVGMTEAFHTETLVRLPECFSCYKAPAHSPLVEALPALKAGRMTFGSFNMFAKMSSETLQTWSRILKAIPTAKLILKYAGLETESMRQLIHGLFLEQGVESQRVEIAARDTSHAQHMARYNSIDIGLDPFPYNGTTTTLDALWMGVPVITLAGNTHVSRVGVSQMRNLGLPELIASDTNDYVNIAVRLANDLPRLVKLRADLRGRMLASPLMNVPRFTSHLEAAYLEMLRCSPATNATAM